MKDRCTRVTAPAGFDGQATRLGAAPNVANKDGYLPGADRAGWAFTFAAMKDPADGEAFEMSLRPNGTRFSRRLRRLLGDRTIEIAFHHHQGKAPTGRFFNGLRGSKIGSKPDSTPRQ